MKDQTWQVEHRGRVIRATNRFSLFPPRTSEVLEMDGVVMAQHQGGFFRTDSILDANVEWDGVSRHVQARIGPKRAANIFPGCHILVDGVRVGGDAAVELRIPDLQEAHRLHAQGALRYMVVKGLLQYGLPFGFFMSLLRWPGWGEESWAQWVSGFVFHALAFGAVIGWLEWRSLKAWVTRNTDHL